MIAAFALPTLGTLVPRRRLHAAVERVSPNLVLVEAPSGYGKTSLAYQLARTRRFGAILWFDGGGLRYDTRALLQALVWKASAANQNSESLSSLSELPLAALRSEFAALVSHHWHGSLCLVLDNVSADPGSDCFESIFELARSSLGAAVFMIVTSRHPLPIPAALRAWYLEPDDLRLDEQEAADLARQYGLDGAQQDRVAQILADSGGHPALFSVMSRASCLAPGDRRRPARQVEEQLLALADSLTSDERAALKAASLLGEGSCRDIGGVLGCRFMPRDLEALASRIPLLRWEADGVRPRFSVHDMAADVISAELEVGGSDAEIFARVLRQLANRGDYVRMFRLLLDHSEFTQTALLVEDHGRHLLELGALGLLREILDAIPKEALVRQPGLLLIEAQLDKITGKGQESRWKARTAKDLAEHEGQESVAVEASLLLVRLLLDAGRTREACRLLESRAVEAANKRQSQAVILSHLAAVYACLGEGDKCRTSLAASHAAAAAGDNAVVGIVHLATCFCLCTIFGEFRSSLSVFAMTRETEGIGIDRRLAHLVNAASAQCHRGRLRPAGGLLDEAENSARSAGADDVMAQLIATRAFLLSAAAQYAEADCAVDQLLSFHDLPPSGVTYALLDRAAWRRAVGDLAGSLADAEEARDILASTELVPLKWQADLEVAATFLALGDVVPADSIATAVLQEAASAQARKHVLAASLLLAEAEIRAGASPSTALHSQRDYLLSEDGNWQATMYIRAFPALLALITEVVGAARIPSHLLQMLKLDGAQRAMPYCREMLPAEEYEILRQRLGESAEEPDADALPSCRVRVFGGLEIVTSDGPVHDADWRKRKARLLFAMLVVRKGKDVPREQLLEYLWPEMDEERAKANFYVVWNNMKRALSPNLGKGEPCPYARAAAGVCRADDLLVSSDLDEFEQCLMQARRAEGSGDSQAVLTAYRRLAEVYRGDLLPGDVYDDWFAPLRERCRQEFGDAMLRAGQLLEMEGDHIGALQMIRAALAHDPWREDLYQAALRCQIAAGQRSAAIETYMACRHKLVEDLGIDPSEETRKLYDLVLAMEEPGAYKSQRRRKKRADEPDAH